MSEFSITESAVNRIQTLAAKDSRENLNLRVYISGGGCAGFQYGFVFEENQNEDDLNFPLPAPAAPDDASVIIDPLSFTYLKDATLDYEVGLRGAYFVIRNPNAETTCGCGSSFSIST